MPTLEFFQIFSVIAVSGMALSIGWTVGVQLLEATTDIIIWLIKRILNSTKHQRKEQTHD